MGKEIERKFLITGDGWRSGQASLLRQGYLSTDKHRTVRVRVSGESAFLTIKGLTRGATRREFEYPIPVDDANEMLDEVCKPPLIEKRRYVVRRDGVTWEIDEFLGENEGLVVAEVELQDEDQTFGRPEWLGEEVTQDPRYYNANLVQRPYSSW